MNRRLKIGGVLVLLLAVLFPFQNCGQMQALDPRSLAANNASGSDSNGVIPNADQIELGKALYAQNCSSCHGGLSSTNKAGRSPNQIFSAINSLSYMSPLKVLSNQEVNAISAALGYDANKTAGQCKGTRVADKTSLFRMTKQEYLNTVADLFGSHASVADGFPPDNDGQLFANDAAQLANVSVELMDAYFTAAEKVVGSLWSTNKSLVLNCSPTSTAPATCASNVIDAWGPRILRRPLQSAERTQLLAMVPTQSGVSVAEFEDGIQSALKAMLISPYFIYRVVAAGSNGVKALDDYELAARLSYFLWSSTVDNELLAAAASGSLKQPNGLRTQITRMLASPKAKRFTQNFAIRWSGLNRLDQVAPDTSVYPNYSSALRADFVTETSTFFENLLAQNLSLRDILNADYTFVNDRLASHYGLGGVSGSQFRRVSLNGTARRGLVSHGSVLMLTSHTDDSSIVKRGKWVMDKVLCDPPPPPPPNVPALPVNNDPSLTKRQRIEAHRSNASCLSCHAKMDPIGFGLENFDAIGGWRTSLNGRPVDNAGALPSGVSFSDAQQLAQYLSGEVTFDQCVSKYLVQYAIGRVLEDQDDCNVKDVASKSVSQSLGIVDTIQTIVTSDLFTKVQGK